MKTNTQDKWQILASLLERGGIPVGETRMTVQVNGIYSIPEFWMKLDGSGAVDQWPYQVKISGITITDGKLNHREMTEDEKKEQETKKIKKVGKKEEVSAIELERIERERFEKEEKERKFHEELDAMEPMARFYKLKEIPTLESWINFPNGKDIGSAVKTDEDLIELEEDVNTFKGVLLEFTKSPLPDEDPKKRPKPKNISSDEVKPVHTVAWIDLTQFHSVPGLTEIEVRAPLQLKESFEKKNDTHEEGTQLEGVNRTNLSAEQHGDVVHDYVEKAQTYIHLKLSLSVPINPTISELSFPDPVSLIKPDEKQVHHITPDEICADFRKQLKIAIAAIAKNYEETMGDSKNNQLVKRDKGNALSNARKEERDNNIGKFLLKFNESGKADLLKEKLKKFIVKIVREKYKKKSSVKGVFKDEKDQFYSELYAYLTDEVKLAMDEFVGLKKDELHENVLSSYEQSRKEILNYAIKHNKEPEEKRLLRLSNEYEILDDLQKSIFYYKARLSLIQTKDSWGSFAILAKKTNSLVDVEEAINNCILGDVNEDLNLKIIFSAVKWLKNRSSDAINFLNIYLAKYEIKNTSCFFNAFLAFLYKDSNQDLLFRKHYEAAKKFKMNEIGMVSKKPKGVAKLKADYKKPVLPVEKCDEIWYGLCTMFNEFQFYEVSEKLLQFIDTENQNSNKFRLEQVKILFFRKDYDAVISLCDTITKNDKQNFYAWMFRGNAYYYKNNLFDSEESYIRAIRCKQDRNEKFNIKMLFRLGYIYIRRKTWNDAKAVFQQILKDNPQYSFAWRYLGFALTRLGEFQPAEEALSEANLLDVENSYTWAYLTIFCILSGRRNQAFECLNEIIKVNFQEVDLLAEISALFYQYGEFTLSADIYQRIIRINPHYIDAYIKLSDIYFNKFDSKKAESIELLKNCLKYTDDEREKQSILNFINQFNNQLVFNPNMEANLTVSSQHDNQFVNHSDNDIFDEMDDIILK